MFTSQRRSATKTSEIEARPCQFAAVCILRGFRAVLGVLGVPEDPWGSLGALGSGGPGYHGGHPGPLEPKAWNPSPHMPHAEA